MSDVQDQPGETDAAETDTVTSGHLDPWMVRGVFGGLLVLAAIGLILGIRGGHPVADTGLAITAGAQISVPPPSSVAPAQALDKDQQWSTLSGPQVLPEAKPAPVASAAPKADKSEAASDSVVEDDARAADQAPADQLPPLPPPTPLPPGAPPPLQPPPDLPL